MQIVTLEVVNDTTYDHLIGIVNVMQGVNIRKTESVFNAVEAPDAGYNIAETAEQHRRHDLFLSMQGAWTSTGIADTEREIAAMREGWL